MTKCERCNTVLICQECGGELITRCPSCMGKKGGKAGAGTEERRQRAQKAAQKRWEGHRKKSENAS